MSGAKDRIKGKVNEALGAVKKKTGRLKGDEQMEAEGTVQQVKGKVQGAIGKVKGKVS